MSKHQLLYKGRPLESYTQEELSTIIVELVGLLDRHIGEGEHLIQALSDALDQTQRITQQETKPRLTLAKAVLLLVGVVAYYHYFIKDLPCY